MDKKTTTRLLLVIITIGALAIGYIYSSYAARPNVGTLAVSKGTVIEGVALSGTVKSQAEADLGFENLYPTRITKLSAQVGDTVKAGAVLAQLENADTQAQYAQALANASGAQSLLDELNASVKKEQLKIKGLSSNDKKVQQVQVTVTKRSVDVQKATLLAAQASVKNMQAQLAKGTIRAPFDGIIAKQDASVGDLANPGIPIITLIGDKNVFEIQAFASQQDIPKIKIGATADVTLDAYGNSLVLPAQVQTIDLSETMQGETPTYKVTFVFSDKDGRLKSGMNANVLLKTNEKTDVIAVPKESIINHDGKQFVLVSSNSSQQEKEVTTGIVGIDGLMEIVSGLNVGDTIVK